MTATPGAPRPAPATPPAGAMRGDGAAPAEPAAPPDGLPPGQRLRAMICVMSAIGLAALDSAIANTALPTIALDLHVGPGASVWVVNIYQFALVATLLPLAVLGETVGQRRINLGGLILFTAASLGCALAWSLPSLVVARAVQGLGGSAIMASNIALVRFIYPARMLGRGVGLNAFVVGLGFALGPTVASAVLLVAPWPWLFAINVPIGLAGIALSRAALPETTRSGHPYDIVAALLTGGAITLLVVGIGEAAHAEPLPRVASEWAGALACGVVLMRRQAGHPAPMLAADLLRRPFFALSAATAVCSFATQSLGFVALPFLLQHALGRSQVETGFLMTPWPIVVAAMGPVAGRLSDRYAPGLLGSIGLAGLAAGMALLALLPAQPTTPDILWRMALCGAGFGFFQAPNMRALMSSAPLSRSGGAGGMAALMRLFGQTIGAALVAACFALAGPRGPTAALFLGSAFAALASVASLLRLGVPSSAASDAA